VVLEDVVFGEQAASGYERWYETQGGQRADSLEKASIAHLLRGFPDAGSVLEAGAGTGHFTCWLMEQGVVAVGLDKSAPMLMQAQAHDGMPLVRGDACRLPFVDGAFDLVALVTTLEFVESPRVALTEALRVARKGLLLGVLNRWSVMGLRRWLTRFFRPTTYDAARFYGVGELKRILQSVGGVTAGIEWNTTLFPRFWPSRLSYLPCGAFIAMALTIAPGR